MISKQQGISLIEVMIAIIVLVVGVLGLMKLQSYMERQSDYAIHSLRALHLAEAKLELFRTRSASGAGSTLSYASINNGCEIVTGVDSITNVASGFVGSCSLAPDSTDYVVSWAVNTSLAGELKTIDVSSSWMNRRNKIDKVSLKTMLSQHSEFD